MMEYEILFEIGAMMTAGGAYLKRVIRVELQPIVARVAALELKFSDTPPSSPTPIGPDITRPIELELSSAE